MTRRPAPPDPDAARLPDGALLTEGPYEHRLKLGRAQPRDFFGPWLSGAASGRLLDERRHWLRTAPSRHLPCLPEAAPAIRELALLARAWHPAADALPEHAPPRETLQHLGELLEPDLVLLGPRTEGSPPVMTAGAVCFPSAWRPEEKLGLPLHAIHQPVPDLNASVGPALDRLLANLKPGAAWIRANWGLAASPELNLHPDRALPRLGPRPDPDSVWLRLEHQALVSLPASGSVLFGIRLELTPIRALTAGHTRALAAALGAMPEAMARYKGLLEARPALLDLLGAAR